MRTLLFISLLVLVPRCAHAGSTRLAVSGSQILLDGRPIKIIGLRCSNALISDVTTDDLIAALDRYRSYGVNTVSVFLMGSRFGNVKGTISGEPMTGRRLPGIVGKTMRCTSSSTMNRWTPAARAGFAFGAMGS